MGRTLGHSLFVDCSRGHIHRLTPDDGSIDTLEIGQVIGAALPCSDGDLVVTSDDGVLLCDKAGVTRLLVPIEPDLTANRMNDGKCDSRGRLWSGTFSTLFHRGAGSLYRIDPDLSLTRAVSNVRVSNGIGWNGDETRMYFVDTLSGGIDVFDYDIDTGAVSNRSQFVTIAREEGLPDGLAVDEEGCVWVALFYGGEVRAIQPSGSPDRKADPSGRPRYQLQFRRPGPVRSLHHHRKFQATWRWVSARTGSWIRFSMFSGRCRVAVATVWISAPAESYTRIGALNLVVAQLRVALAAPNSDPKSYPQPRVTAASARIAFFFDRENNSALLDFYLLCGRFR